MTRNSFRSKASRGFTLIELLIVVVIVGILAAVAIPAYTTYLSKARMAEVISAVGPAETTATEYALSNNGFKDFSSTNIDTTVASKYIDSITVDGTPDNTLTLQILVNQHLLSDGSEALNFVGNFQTSGVTWECEVPTTSPQLAKLAPSSCKRLSNP